MPQAFAVPPPVQLQGEQPSQAALQERRVELRQSSRIAIERADGMLRSQQTISEELGQQLGQLREQGEQLHDLEQRDQESGLLAQLVRSINRRQRTLERRSAAEGLLERYQAVSAQLGRAAAFTDELQLCALELQSSVETLHAEIETAQRTGRSCAGRLQQLTRTLDDIEQASEPVAGRAGLVDKLGFELQHETLRIELFEAQARLLGEELEPARALRDTMLELYREMSAFVRAARSNADSAGRRIQALGLAADAPLVVAELQSSLEELGSAMRATEDYVSQTQRLLVDVLPGLSAQLEARVSTDGELLSDDLGQVSRERARATADRALRRAAEAEVDDWLDEEP